MISKNQIKHIAALHLKKNREQERLFLVEGDKVVRELLNSNYTVSSLYALEEWSEKNTELLEKKNISATTIEEFELDKISALTTPQKVVAVVEMSDGKINLGAHKGKLTLVLDEVKDPGNLGTIIRIADWFGIENIICSENTVDVYNPKVVQATMGSLFRVNVFYEGITSILKENQNALKLPVYAASMKGTSVYDASLSKEGLIILGNESEGVGQELLDYVDHALTIPSFAKGNHAESLNVAVATAIVCSEFRRRNK